MKEYIMYFLYAVIFSSSIGCGVEEDTKGEHIEAIEQIEQVEPKEEPQEPVEQSLGSEESEAMSAYSFKTRTPQDCREGYLNAYDMSEVNQEIYKNQIDGLIDVMERGDQVFIHAQTMFYVPELGIATKEFLDINFDGAHIIQGDSYNLCLVR